VHEEVFRYVYKKKREIKNMKKSFICLQGGYETEEHKQLIHTTHRGPVGCDVSIFSSHLRTAPIIARTHSSGVNSASCLSKFNIASSTIAMTSGCEALMSSIGGRRD